MIIRVKILNEQDKSEVKKEEKPRILTSEYVRKVNEGIAYRMQQRGSEDAQATKILMMKKCR